MAAWNDADMGNVQPLRPGLPTGDPVAKWGRALVDGEIEPDDIPGPIVRLVMAWLAAEVRKS